MKVTVTEKEDKQKYPCLMENNDGDFRKVILFPCSGWGLVVLSNSPQFPVGMYHTFDEGLYLPFRGKITLENE